METVFDREADVDVAGLQCWGGRDGGSGGGGGVNGTIEDLCTPLITGAVLCDLLALCYDES